MNGSGTLSSPGFPRDYPNAAYKKFHLKTSEGFRIRLIFTHFHLEANYDFVTIYASLNCSITKVGQVTKLTGDIYGHHVLLSSGSNLWIVFSSDFSVTKKGFQALYQQVDKRLNKTIGM